MTYAESVQDATSAALFNMEDPLEQQSGLVLRPKQEGERHVYKAPAQGGSLLGLDRLAVQKRAEQGKPEPQGTALAVSRLAHDACQPWSMLLYDMCGNPDGLLPMVLHVCSAAKRAKLFAAAADDEDDGGQNGAAVNTDAPHDARRPAQQSRQFRGQRIETPSRPGKSLLFQSLFTA